MKKLNIKDLELSFPKINIRGLSVGGSIVNEMFESVEHIKKTTPSFITCQKCQMLVPHDRCDK